MRRMMPNLRPAVCAAAVFVMVSSWHGLAQAQALVPGTGTKIRQVGDDFEDEKFTFLYNAPKSSANIDQQERHPSGGSTNNRWLESLFRGTPDIVRRVETPPGGIPGSKGALLLGTVDSGIPGVLSYKDQQDDLIANVSGIIGQVPVQRGPSLVVRVRVPPYEDFEQRTGSSFGVRLDCQTTKMKPLRKRLFSFTGGGMEIEPYWPGIFVQYFSKKRGAERDAVMLVIRGDQLGHEVPGPEVKPGWITLGMSVTPDGQVHYYGKQGVANLTARDHLYSGFPYGYKAEYVNSFFFNVVNRDDGKSWSTPWVIDDPSFYMAY